MTKAFIYCRVSTVHQTDGDGYDRQEAACRNFAASKGWHIARVFREAQSGSDEWSSRKFLSEAMELAGAPATDINIIIVERSDRLARDLVVGELFLRECQKRSIQVFAADSQQDLVNSDQDPTRTLIRQILGSLSQWEKSCICRKLQAGRRAKAALTGKPCGGCVANPYGDRGGIAQQNVERSVLRHIVNLRREGFSCERIAKNLRDSRTQTPNRSNKVPWQWSGDIVDSLVKRWEHRPEMAVSDNSAYYRHT